MAYSELIKNFEKIRAYMRDFYVFGFKSRADYDAKSARSYDDERRRIESWLGDYMRFAKTAEGKNVFLSVDSRVIKANPLYQAWKAKSFTDGDITLHFLLFDILYDETAVKTLTEIIAEIDAYLEDFAVPMTFDESTVRKKLKEYAQEGLVQIRKEGRKVFYSRTPQLDISLLTQAIDFFSEAALCGVIGSFIQEELPPHAKRFTFKHHYITSAIDSDILAQLFEAIHEKRFITAMNFGKHTDRPVPVRIVPLKIFISAQNGRQNVIAYHERSNRINSYRLDYLSDIRMEEVCDRFDDFRKELEKVQTYMWGVNAKWGSKALEHVEFTVFVGENEQYIAQRLEKEKRCGSVEQVDEHHYRFTADVFDSSEMVPWLRTFISRITQLSLSNREAEQRLKEDLQEMYRMYGITDAAEQEETDEAL